MKYTLLILSWFTVFAWLAAATAHAQTVGTCVPAKAVAYLDVNNVRARIFNNGGLFWSGPPYPLGYEVPKGGGVHAIFNSSIWIGGLVQDELRVAAARHRDWQFWPGPLDDQGNPPADCAPYDRIYEITRDDLITYAETGIASDNLRHWPWLLGAPVVDGDGIEGNYDLDGGDRPALMGDQMLWWVMNDTGNEHLFRESNSPPIGMEVHVSAFAFDRPTSYVNDFTFYRYKLLYKGHEPFDEVHFGVFVDADLGNFDDDYVGSDSTLHLGFTYNSDNFDEGTDGYGEAPPAIGYTFLRTATDADGLDNDRDGQIDEAGEDQNMTAFVYFNTGGGVTECPQIARHYYNYLRARWKNDRHLTLGGNGLDFSETPTNFMFSGDPTTGAFWSEINRDGQGTGSRPGYRRFFMSTGPFTMQPGEAQEIVVAVVWARGDDHLDSVRQLKSGTARLHEVADEILVPDVTFRVPEPPPAPADVLGFAQNFPNPFSSATTIRYSLPQSMVIRLRVYDVLGREVATLVNGRQAPGIYTVEFDGASLPTGVYFYRIEMDHLRSTKHMTLTR